MPQTHKQYLIERQKYLQRRIKEQQEIVATTQLFIQQLQNQLRVVGTELEQELAREPA